MARTGTRTRTAARTRKPPAVRKPYTQKPWASGATVEWTDGGDSTPRTRTGTAWGPGDIPGSLWVVPENPDHNEAAVLLRRAPQDKTAPDAPRPAFVLQTETCSGLSARLRRTNALDAPGATVVTSWWTETVPVPAFARHHETVHLTGCAALPEIAREAAEAAASRAAVMAARLAATTPAQRRNVAALDLPAAGQVGVSDPRSARPFVLCSRDGLAPRDTTAYVTSQWCPYCLDEPGMVHGARAALADAQPAA